MKLIITFPPTDDMPPQFAAISACEAVIMEMQTPEHGNHGSVSDGQGGVIVWVLEEVKP